MENKEDNCNPSVSKTLKHEAIHLSFSIALGLLLWILYSDLLVSLYVFGLSFFLDADHLLDYILYLLRDKKDFSLKEFLSGTYFKEWKKFITPLHSWEVVIISLLFFYIFQNQYLLATGLGLGVHYVLDYFMNDVNKKAYFLLFRAKHLFLKEAIKP